MKSPDPPDDFEETILETFNEMLAEAPTVLTFPPAVTEIIESYEKAHSLSRDRVIGLALKAQMERTDHLSQVCAQGFRVKGSLRKPGSVPQPRRPLE